MDGWVLIPNILNAICFLAVNAVIDAQYSPPVDFSIFSCPFTLSLIHICMSRSLITTYMKFNTNYRKHLLPIFCLWMIKLANDYSLQLLLLRVVTLTETY